MKLNPPASSSDLETARQIARRLHQSRRRDDRTAANWSAEEAPVRPRLAPPPLPSRPAPAELPALEPRAEARVQAPARPQTPARATRAPAPEPALPDMSVETDSEGPSFDVPGEPLDDLAGADEPTFESGAAGSDVDVDVDVDVVDEPALSPEEMVGQPELDVSPLDQLTEPNASPFGEELLDAAPVADEPAPPSWEDVVENCKGLAQASGAMLIDPAGQVFAARGDWPAPGPDAIAGKLVSMMAKTLKDAPTRSISAPLSGMHLTAWRVPLSEGLVTVAFIGPALGAVRSTPGHRRRDPVRSRVLDRQATPA